MHIFCAFAENAPPCTNWTMGPYGQSMFCIKGEVAVSIQGHWFKPVPWGTMTPIKGFFTKQLRSVLNWLLMCDATNGVDEFWLLSVQLEQHEMPRCQKVAVSPTDQSSRVRQILSTACPAGTTFSGEYYSPSWTRGVMIKKTIEHVL